MADVKHCTASPINDFEGFLHIFYCRIKNFTESLTEKLLRQVGRQGRVQNNRNSPHDVQSPDCRVLTQTYSQNFFSSRFFFVDRCLSFSTFSFGHCVSLFFFDIRILITPLVSSNSYLEKYKIPLEKVTITIYRFIDITDQCKVSKNV
jgi:hypothetical protein